MYPSERNDKATLDRWGGKKLEASGHKGHKMHHPVGFCLFSKLGLGSRPETKVAKCLPSKRSISAPQHLEPHTSQQA